MFLSTGYGKSLCSIILPQIFYFVRGARNKSIIVVVSPLTAQSLISVYVNGRIDCHQRCTEVI